MQNKEKEMNNILDNLQNSPQTNLLISYYKYYNV